jgi:tellurite resistance protein TerC
MPIYPDTPSWFWVAFTGAVLLLLAFDLGLAKRKGDAPVSLQSAFVRTGVYVALALLFAGGLYRWRSPDSAVAFVTGFLIEWSLSVDNVFVFVLVFAHFAVPERLQHRVLFWGILGALAMRGGMIAAGAALLASFHWIAYVFGAILIVSGVKMLMAADSEPDVGRNRLVVLLRRNLRVTEDFEGSRFFVRRDTLLYVTPLFLALAVIEISDLVFAVDSIPAIFAVTADPFIVYTANVFAILGLRSLYFALAGVVHKFHYLKYGLSMVLMVIGAKMIVNGIFGDVIPTWLALAVTALLVGGSIVLSLMRPKPPRPSIGWVPGCPPAERERA